MYRSILPFASSDFRYQSVIKFIQAFNNHLGLSNNRHEIGIAVPAWNDVPMEVIWKPRARRFAEVEPDIVSVRTHHPIEHVDQPGDRFDRFGSFFSAQFTQGTDVRTGRDE